jgi:hypothetical protein
MVRDSGLGPTLSQILPAFKAGQAVDFPPDAAYHTIIVPTEPQPASGALRALAVEFIRHGQEKHRIQGL